MKASLKPLPHDINIWAFVTQYRNPIIHNGLQMNSISGRLTGMRLWELPGMYLASFVSDSCFAVWN